MSIVESLSASMMYVPDSNLVQDLDESELAAPKHSTTKLNPQPEPVVEPPGPHVSISTTKVNDYNSFDYLIISYFYNLIL